MGEPGSAGTHSCCMVPFQEELLDLFVFTGSQIVRERARARMRKAGRWSNRVDLLGHSDTPLLWFMEQQLDVPAAP